jgi:hypothetical protein
LGFALLERVDSLQLQHYNKGARGGHRPGEGETEGTGQERELAKKMVSDISPVFFFNDQPITFREPMKSTNETSSSDPSNNLSVPKESNLLQYSECNLLSALMPRSKSLSSKFTCFFPS